MLFFFEIVLAIWSPLKFHMNFRMVLFIPEKKKKAERILGTDCVESVYCFREYYCHSFFLKPLTKLI